MPPSRRPPSSATNGSPSLNSVHPVPASTTHTHIHAHMHPPPQDDRDSRSEISGPTSTHPQHPHLNPPPSTASSTTISKPRRALASHGGGHGNGNRDERGIGFNTNATNTTNTTTTTTTTAATTSFQPSSNSTAINANGTHAHDGIEGISWHLVPLPVLHRYRHAYRLRVPSASSFYNNIILAQGIGKRSPSRAGYIFPHSTPSSSSYSNRGHMAINPLQHHYHPGLVRDGSGLSEMSFGGDLSGMVAEDGAISGVGIGNGRGGGGGVRRGRVTREQLATVVRKNFNAQPISESDVIVNFLYSVKNQDKTFRLRFPPR